MPDLVVENLACRRGGRTLFSELSFELDGGRALLLTGSNGSGKTSLLRILASLLPAAAGRVCWRGRDVREDRDAWLRSLGWFGHADGVKGDLTVRENLQFELAANGRGLAGTPVAARQRCDAAAESFGLLDLADRPCRYLSAGQRRRVALARLIVGQSKVWLMDEPAAALDARSAGQLHAAIVRHVGEGGIAVIATHGDVVVEDAARIDLGARDRTAETGTGPA